MPDPAIVQILHSQALRTHAKTRTATRLCGSAAGVVELEAMASKVHRKGKEVEDTFRLTVSQKHSLRQNDGHGNYINNTLLPLYTSSEHMSNQAHRKLVKRCIDYGVFSLGTG